MAESTKAAPKERGMTIGGVVFPVIDPQAVQTVSADFIIAAGEHNSVVNLSLATAVLSPVSGGGLVGDLVVCTRLRMTLATAIDIRNTLDGIVKKAMPAKEKVN